MQTPYGVLLYQTPTSRNCKPFKTQLCSLLLAAYKTQRFKACMRKPVSYQWVPISNSMLLIKQMTQTQTHRLHYLNAHLDPQIN